MAFTGRRAAQKVNKRLKSSLADPTMYKSQSVIYGGTNMEQTENKSPYAGTQTEKNLQAAIAGESTARNN